MFLSSGEKIMKYIIKLFFYLLICSTLMIFGFEAIKFSRDQVRIGNADTLSRVIQNYQLTEHRLPPSGRRENVSQFLFDRKLTDKMVRDPVFTSATVILDEYVFTLIRIYDKLMNSDDIKESERLIGIVKGRVEGIFEDTEDANEQILTLKALARDNDIQKNLSTLKEIVNLSDKDLKELQKILKDSDLKRNMEKLRDLAAQPVSPDFVIAYQADNRKNHYEISVKLESRFLMHRMREDGGNDDERFEIGNELKLNTEVKSYGKSARAVKRKTSLIK